MHYLIRKVVVYEASSVVAAESEEEAERKGWDLDHTDGAIGGEVEVVPLASTQVCAGYRGLPELTPETTDRLVRPDAFWRALVTRAHEAAG